MPKSKIFRKKTNKRKTNKRRKMNKIRGGELVIPDELSYDKYFAPIITLQDRKDITQINKSIFNTDENKALLSMYNDKFKIDTIVHESALSGLRGEISSIKSAFPDKDLNDILWYFSIQSMSKGFEVIDNVYCICYNLPNLKDINISYDSNNIITIDAKREGIDNESLDIDNVSSDIDNVSSDIDNRFAKIIEKGTKIIKKGTKIIKKGFEIMSNMISNKTRLWYSIRFRKENNIKKIICQYEDSQLFIYIIYHKN
jgi:hypothetical protein